MRREEFAVTLTSGLYHWMSAGWERERFLEAKVNVRLKDRQFQTPARRLLKA
jgi:hypothetical protein